MAAERDFIDVFEAADFLGIHVQTLRRLARQGKVPGFKVGRDWRFRRAALFRWADEQSQANDSRSAPLALVIDDDEKVCKAMADAITRLGLRARRATGGRAGLALLAQEAPDIVLLDLKMPDLDGATVLERLRQTHPDLPVVIVTAYPDSDLVARAMRQAPVLLLEKPLDRASLARTVSVLLGERVPDHAGARAEARSPGSLIGEEP